MNAERSDFDSWWEREGQFYDPDFEDVPWYDKRRELARKAFEVALAISGNYTVDQEVFPKRVTFSNGRVVSVSMKCTHLIVGKETA